MNSHELYEGISMKELGNPNWEYFSLVSNLINKKINVLMTKPIMPNLVPIA